MDLLAAVVSLEVFPEMATCYWYYGGTNQDLADSSNNWDDAAHTTPFSGNSGAGYPGSSDDLVILGSTMPTSNSGVTALHSWDSSGAATGTTISGTVTSGIAIGSGGGVTVGVAGDATSAHTFAGSTDYGTYVAQGGGSITQGANVNSVWSLTLSDSGSFSGSMLLGNGSTGSSVTMSGSSTFSGTLGINDSFISVTITTSGSATYSGSVQFASSSFGNSSYTIILGAGCTFSGSIYDGGQTQNTVTMDLIVNGGTFSGQVTQTSGYGSSVFTLTFNNSSVLNGCTINKGSVTLSGTPTFTGTVTLATTGSGPQLGNLTVNDNVQITGLTISSVGAVTLNDSADLHQNASCTSITANDTSLISSGTIACSGALTFNDNSTGTGGTINGGPSSIVLNSPKAINGITINPANGASITGAQNLAVMPFKQQFGGGY